MRVNALLINTSINAMTVTVRTPIVSQKKLSALLPKQSHEQPSRHRCDKTVTTRLRHKIILSIKNTRAQPTERKTSYKHGEIQQ